MTKLKTEVLQTISVAQDYLRLRQAGTLNPDERSRIQYWYATLQDLVAKTASEDLVINSRDPLLLEDISLQLKLTRQGIEQLHTFSGYSEVEFRIQKLHDQVLTLWTGPHGTGGGRP